MTEEGYKTTNYHGAIPANERASNFATFISGESNVLVTTDLAARELPPPTNKTTLHIIPKRAFAFLLCPIQSQKKTKTPH